MTRLSGLTAFSALAGAICASLAAQLGVLQRSAGALSDERVQGLLDVAAWGPVRVDVAGGDVDECLQPLHACREGRKPSLLPAGSTIRFLQLADQL